MSASRGKKWLVMVGIIAVIFTAMQLVRPTISHPPVTGEPEVPPQVGAILKKACYDCHSNETELAWFDQLTPANWLVADHIEKGRAALNFSEWDKLPAVGQKGKLFWALNDILAHEMPLPSYLKLHPKARLSSADIDTLKNYIAGLASRPQPTAYQEAIPFRIDTQTVTSVQPTANGIAYIPNYRNWKAISTTDRFDNGTMRVIYGNEIAERAIQEQHINPWPDGTVFAKVAWEQQADSSGLIRAGKFVQVEFMIKDSKKYTSTHGWGWARWKGNELIPYGKDKGFTTECISCHRPVKANDFVFTFPLHLQKH